MMRAFGPIDWPAKDIFRCICYAPLRKEWDVNNDVMMHTKKIGANAYITYSKTIKKFVISARDFVVNYIINEEADGSILFCASSDNCQHDIAENSGVVRAYTALSGYIIKPDPNDPNKSFISMCNEIDLKGGIPEFAMRQVLKDTGY